MSTQRKSLVSGYIRNNYQLYVPEVIVKRCLLYFDPEVIIKVKKRDFQSLIKLSHGNSINRVIKFNQSLSFILKICPNGKNIENQGYVQLSLMGNMAQNVNYYSISYEISCIETQSFVQIYEKCNKETNNKGWERKSFMTLSDCKQHNEFTFKFIIRSLEINYKTDKKSNNRPLLYPSLIARSLKQYTSLNWKPDVEKFKKCCNRQQFHSQIVDNWNLICYPKGDIHQHHTGLMVDIAAISWPLGVSRMIVKVRYKVRINRHTLHLKKWAILKDTFEDGAAFNIYNEAYWRTKAAWNCGGLTDLPNINDMEINVFVTIETLSDMDDNQIPLEKWKDHNVQILETREKAVCQ